MMRRKLEVCVEDVAGIAAAAAGGADRIELCAALAVGGLTPPLSLIRVAAASPLPVHLLARPREGDFVYSRVEAMLVAEDIRTAAEAGLAGVVIGASDRQRRLDVGLLAQWVGQARVLGAERGAPLSLTLHRAFDLCPDLPAALEDAIQLGFDRVLTSGGAPRAVDGAAMLQRLHEQAAGRIGILAGSGVNRATLPALLATGIAEVHASCRQSHAVPEDWPERRFGFMAAQIGGTDVETVAGLVHDLHANASLE